MGNSGSQAVTAAAVTLQERKKKEKKRCRKFACFCVWCNVGAIVSLVVGVILLAYFASSLGDNYTKQSPPQPAAKGITYTGIALMILGFLLLIMGVLLVFLLVATYRRFTGKSASKPLSQKSYAQGTAPYPQQDWGNAPNPHHPEASPIAPAEPPAQPAGGGEWSPPPMDSSTMLIKPELS